MFKPLLLSLAFCLYSFSAFAEWHRHEEVVFGTDFVLELWAESNIHAEITTNLVIAEMWRLHNMLSPWIEGSELSQINAKAAEKNIQVSAEMAMLLNKSFWFSRISGGAFDPTFASVGHSVNYREGISPNPDQLSDLATLIDYRQVELDTDVHSIRFLKSGIKLDLGGLAKGYAMDRAVNILSGTGIEHASVSAGGDMRLLGDKRGRPWVMGIRNPRAEETAIRLPLENIAVSTSGDYERFFIDESGERVHHILDPKTGKSAAKLSSVTIMGESGLDTDPLSTTVFVLGAEAGMALVEQLEGFDAILIDVSGQVFYSSGLSVPE